MNDELFNSDIEDPYERLIEECKWRMDLYDLSICKYNSKVCQECIYDGSCTVLKEYFKRKGETI